MSLASLFTEKSAEKAHDLQGFVYPFTNKNVERIMIWMTWEYREPSVWAIVYFKNENTKGEHQIKSTSLEDLLPRIKAFLEAMKP